MRTIVTVMLVAVGLIHLGPLVGVFGPERLSMLYGIDVAEPNVEILMRHRAVLLGVLGGILVFAGFRPALQPVAIVSGAVSTVSFIVLSAVVGGHNDRILSVVWVDVLAAVALAVAVVLRWRLGARAPETPSSWRIR